KVSARTTQLNYWNGTVQSNQAQELEGSLRYMADEAGTFLNRYSVEVGGRHTSSDFTTPAVGSYDWGWLAIQGTIKQGENLTLTGKLQGQGGNGLGLPLKVFPAIELMWRAFQTGQLDLHWRTDRYVDDFHSLFGDMEHVSPVGGFPSPTEITSEFGGRFTQKVTEKIVASASGSVAQLTGYH